MTSKFIIISSFKYWNLIKKKKSSYFDFFVVIKIPRNETIFFLTLTIRWISYGHYSRCTLVIKTRILYTQWFGCVSKLYDDIWVSSNLDLTSSTYVNSYLPLQLRPRATHPPDNDIRTKTLSLPTFEIKHEIRIPRCINTITSNKPSQSIRSLVINLQNGDKITREFFLILSSDSIKFNQKTMKF